MTNTIDDKVVAMSFESSKFESGVNSTISSIDKLKASLHFPDAGKGFDKLNASAKAVDLSHIADGVDTIKSRLNAFSVAAIAIFANVAMKAVSAGARFAKAFAIGPIVSGFQEYSTNLNAVQTILANTQSSGATLKDVNAALLQLNKYSDKTIYNFSQMAKNIGTFTAAGVDLKTSTESIKGIANLAALSGSNADQASTAMYQLSQAIAAGSVKLQDWNSVVNAGMGGTVFQRALAQTAEKMGTLQKGSVKLTGAMKNVTIHGQAFRNSLSVPGKASWLTSDVLTKTLSQFTGDLSDAQLAAEGFNAAEIKAIQQTAKTAQQAATQVKTISQVIDVAKETAGSGWAQTWQIIFGNFGQAKTLFTGLSNAVNGFINTSSRARNNILKDWAALGGRTMIIEAIKTLFVNLGKAVEPIRKAFRDIFPASTGKSLFDLTKKFEAFARAVKPSQDTVDNLRRTFRGVFAALDIGKQILVGVVRMFGKLFGSVGAGSGGFLKFTGNMGDFIVQIDNALKKGNRLTHFFEGLGKALAKPVNFLKNIAHSIGNLFSQFSSAGASKTVDGMTKALTPFHKMLSLVNEAWDKFRVNLHKLRNLAGPAIDGILKAVVNFGNALGQAASNLNFDHILQVIQTGLFAGLVLMFKNFLGKGSIIEQLSGKGNGIFKTFDGTIRSFKGTLGALTGSLTTMQNNIKAKTLKEIAIAVGILAASIAALSLVDPKKLSSSLTGMTVAFGQLIGAMALLTTVAKGGGLVQIPVIAGSLILLAGAIDTLSISVVALSFLSWDQLLKGLTGVGALLGGMVGASAALSKSSGGLITAGAGIALLSVGIRILASAVQSFGNMSWTNLIKGLAGVATSLVLIATGMESMPPSMVVTAAGIVIVAVALRVLANVVAKFGAMNLKDLGKGLIGIAGALTGIALAMELFPPDMTLTAVGLVVVSIALGKIVKAVQTMGGMSWKEIARGLATLAASLGILALALVAMQDTVQGSAALLIAAVGVSVLAKALTKLGKMSWREIIKSLVTLAGAFVVLGAAGALLTPVIPSLLGLGAALVLIGGGLALAGAGVALIGVGLSAIAVAGPTAVGILVAALLQLTNALPEMGKNFILGLLEIVRALADTAPKFVDAIIKIITSLVLAVQKAMPHLIQLFGVIVDGLVKILHDHAPQVIQAGLALLLALLNGIKNNIQMIAKVAVDVVVNLLKGLSSQVGRILIGGADLLIALLKGITNGLGRVVTAAISIVTSFLGGIANNLGKIALMGLTLLAKFIGAIVLGLGKVVTLGAQIIVKLIDGLSSMGRQIITAATTAIGHFIRTMVNGALRMVDVGAQAIVKFLNGVADAINKYEPQMIKAGFRIGVAIVTGMIKGLASMADTAINKAKDLANSVAGAIGGALHIHSPSKVTHDIGENLVLGLANGMANSKPATDAAIALGNSVISAIRTVFQIASPSKVMYQLGQFVSQGFAQGIRGSAQDIQSAWVEMNDKLLQAMQISRATIATEQDKLAKLMNEKKPDATEIAKIQAVIAQNEDILRRSTAAHQILVVMLKGEKSELVGLANQYQAIGEKLKQAQQALIDAKKLRDDAIQGFTDQYSTLPDIVTTDAEGNSIDQLAAYEAALKHQADAVAAYQSTLDQLRALGLDDATYQKLLTEGTADQAFADQLLAGGKTAVEGLNALDAQLKANATVLAKHAGNDLYQAGVDAAQGLVNGLKSKHDAIRKQMEAIARMMIQAIRTELGIASPSKLFAEIGSYAMQGLAQGFADARSLVTSAVEDASKNALSAMKKSMRDISDVVTNELNPNPVITPILDLTQVRSQTSELAALTATTPITAATSYGQANAISSAQQASEAELVAAGGVTKIEFNQTNTSPKALSEIEIYRQTNNQLSQLKSVLVMP